MGAGVLVAAALAFVLWPPLPTDGVGAWMAADGVQPRYETVGGLRLRYVRKGQGPPVVLLHGIASSIYTWKDVLPLLAAHHDVVALDMPGFGGSDVPSHPDGEVLVASVLGLLDRLGIARASVAGNSLGGATAVALAARAPARVDRLVLIDAAGYNFAPADRPFLLRLTARAPAGLAELLPLRPMVTLALRQVFHDDALVTPARVAEYVVPLRRPGASAGVRRLLLATDSLGFPAVVRSVRVPTLVVWGRYDAWIPSRDADFFARDIPGARVVMVETGHMPQEEHPPETARLIEEFLSVRE